TALPPLSLHDALPISGGSGAPVWSRGGLADGSDTSSGRRSIKRVCRVTVPSRPVIASNELSTRLTRICCTWVGSPARSGRGSCRSEEHTSELQSRENL